MENKKQTAVEWLFNKLLLMNPNLLGFGDYLEQAKELDKQQKMDAWNDGNCNTDLKGNPSANYAISAEHYCKEQYGS